MEATLEVVDREAEQIVKQIGLPPCPVILTKIMGEMRRDDPDFEKLGELIAGDVSLAASMLKTVNSPFYGLSSKATSVQQALALLGLRHVATLVTGLLLRQAFPGGHSAIMDEFWEVTAGIGRVNTALTKRFRHVNRDALQTFALFRDCGMLAMIKKYKDYKPVFPGTRRTSTVSVTALEDARFKVNHARVGYQMAKNWQLPDETCEAVLRHHEYARLMDTGAGVSLPSRQHIALTLAAEAIYVKHEHGVASHAWALGGPFALKELGISQAEFESLAREVTAELEAEAH